MLSTLPQTVSVVVVYKATATTSLIPYTPNAVVSKTFSQNPYRDALVVEKYQIPEKTKLFLSCCAPV